MNVHKPEGQEGQPHDEVVHVEVEIEDRVELLVVPVTEGMVLVEVIRTKLEVAGDMHFFERDRDEPFHHHPHGRKHVRVVGH
uniref:hypothetical protein n=1 Tax=Stenotrophomonas maltophilia TaxID=40324 RepID=UPI0013DA6662